MNGRARMAAMAVAGTILGCAMAPPAHAARAYVNYDSLVISADPYETNSLRVQPHPTDSQAYLIIDTGAKIAPGPGCTKTALGRVAVCTMDFENGFGPPSLSLHLYDGNDTAEVNGSYRIVQADGGTGNDRLDLTAGNDAGYTHIQLGTGDDTLKLVSGYGDQIEVYGGDGNDDIEADTLVGTYYGGRGDDTINANGWISGGDGADTLVGTSTGYAWYGGWDRYFGDAGNDIIDTADIWYDEVDCGTGIDSATRDGHDGISNCER